MNQTYGTAAHSNEQTAVPVQTQLTEPLRCEPSLNCNVVCKEAKDLAVLCAWG